MYQEGERERESERERERERERALRKEGHEVPSRVRLREGPIGVRRERERDLREETVYCSPAWDCGKGSLV